MTDRVYPSGKPNGTAARTTTNNNNINNPTPHQFPPPKSHLYNTANRHPYRPNPTAQTRRNHRRCSCRPCFCRCCFWSILVFLIILLLATIAGAIFYVLYRPHHPNFSVTSLKISQFNLTTAPADDTTRLTTKLNFTLTCTNPNNKITFFYDPITVNIFSNQVLLGNGTFGNFTSTPNNIHPLHSTLAIVSELLDPDSANSLKSDLKKKNGLPLMVVMETNVKVKLEKLKSRNIGIKVICDGIHGITPKDKNPTTASANNAKCKVNLRIKIWKFNF